MRFYKCLSISFIVEAIIFRKSICENRSMKRKLDFCQMKKKKLFIKVVRPQKLGPRQKYIFSLTRIAILLLEGSFERKKIIFHGQNRNKEK